MDSLIQLGQSLAAQVEKVSRLQLDAGLASSRDAIAATQALFEVKDADGLAKWQADYLQPNFDRAADSARQQYALLLETRGILADAVKQSTSEATRQIQENIDRIA
ncbi:MAG: phasin family protein, partial [Zoogloea sp.]|nr:phasin family protein [Zoogloea sp.]